MSQIVQDLMYIIQYGSVKAKSVKVINEPQRRREHREKEEMLN